jgi:uncharacterized membrane protein YkvA (DUF1232 family)
MASSEMTLKAKINDSIPNHNKTAGVGQSRLNAPVIHVQRLIEDLRTKARALKRETLVLYLAARDPRTPRAAKLVIAIVVAYALSPIDLIPDFIPILGCLDDLVLLPLGVYLAINMIPATVLADARQAAQEANGDLAKSRAAAIAVIILWTIGAVLTGLWLLRAFGLV